MPIKPSVRPVTRLGVWLVAALQLLNVPAFGATQDGPPPPEPVEHVYAQPNGTQLKVYVF